LLYKFCVYSGLWLKNSNYLSPIFVSNRWYCKYFVSQAVNLPIEFDCGSLYLWDFFVITLDDSCKVVLGYDWLQYIKPVVNWKLNELDVKAHIYKVSSNPLPNSNCPPVSSKAEFPVDSNIPQEKSRVSLISTVAYTYACRTRGLLAFQLTIRDLGILYSHLISVEKTKTSISQVSNNYLKFANVFNKYQAKQLLLYYLYDLTIYIKNGSTPLSWFYLLVIIHRVIYSMRLHRREYQD